MKLHWSPKSPYVRKVMICAQELACLERFERVRSVAAMLKPNAQLMQDNPLSKIPALVLDDGSTLIDSPVICEYLNELAGGTLFPATGPAKWQALRWQAFGDGLLDALILWRNEREREMPLPALLAAFELKARATLDLFEAEVKALTDAPLSIGQITVGVALGYIDYRFDAMHWRAQVPQLAAWHAVLCLRPSFVATEPGDG
jgi:glutathione S-transferase